MSLPLQSAPPPSSVARQPVPAHMAVAKAGAKNTEAKSDDTKSAATKKEGGFSFLDFLDIVNPLQHIPIVSSIYRELTGDTIKGPARVLGGALFGGPIGALLGGVNAVVASEHNGKDVGELALNKVGIGSKDAPAAAEVKTAAAKTDAKGNEKIPVVEVRPLANDFTTLPLSQSPFASVKAADIRWDEPVAQLAGLPATKQLNELKPVSGFDPAFDAVAQDDKASPAKMDEVKSGLAAEDLSPESVQAFDKAMSKLAASSSAADLPGAASSTPTAASSASPAVAPVASNQIPTQMMSALSKYQSMQQLSDKAVISPKIAQEATPASRPFAKLDQKIRRVAAN